MLSTRRLSNAFVMVVLFGLFGGFANLLVILPAGQVTGEAGTSTAFLIAWAIVYGFTALLIARPLAQGIHARDVGAGIFLGFIIVSALWSQMPGQTLTYSVSFAANVAFAWYCARKYSMTEFLTILRNTLAVLLLLGLVAAALGISSAFYYDQINRSNVLGTPPIQGLTSHKIYAGVYGAICFVLSITEKRRIARIALCGISLLAILLSGSSVGLVALLIGVTMVIYFRILTNSDLRILAILMTTVLVASTIVFLDQISQFAASALGRDVGLTGRVDIWNFAIEFFKEKPFLGWGYAGIFGDYPNAPGRIVVVSSYVAPHFHNNYLQVMAELGVVGTLMYGSMVLYVTFIAFRNVSYYGRSVDISAAAVLSIILLVGSGMLIGTRYNELCSTLLFYLFFKLPSARAEVARLKAATATSRAGSRPPR